MLMHSREAEQLPTDRQPSPGNVNSPNNYRKWFPHTYCVVAQTRRIPLTRSLIYLPVNSRLLRVRGEHTKTPESVQHRNEKCDQRFPYRHGTRIEDRRV
jgi:hypothetical protein